MEHLCWLSLSFKSLAKDTVHNQSDLESQVLKLCTHFQPGKIMKIVQNKFSACSFFVKFECVEKAGMVRIGLEGMYLEDLNSIVQAQFVCPDSLKEHILERCFTEISTETLDFSRSNGSCSQQKNLLVSISKYNNIEELQNQQPKFASGLLERQIPRLMIDRCLDRLEQNHHQRGSFWAYQCMFLLPFFGELSNNHLPS